MEKRFDGRIIGGNSKKTSHASRERFVFALASVCFVLVGIPLGIRSHRKESSIGMAISLAVALGYYMVVILMLSFDEMYLIHPEFLIYLPAVACLALASWLLRRNM